MEPKDWFKHQLSLIYFLKTKNIHCLIRRCFESANRTDADTTKSVQSTSNVILWAKLAPGMLFSVAWNKSRLKTCSIGN